jgi:hypothetical protein
MLNWLRRRLGRLNRRWIEDPAERDRHHEIVDRRLPGPDDSTDSPGKRPGARD